MDKTQIAWVNLAKCRVPIDMGAVARGAEAKLTRLCQTEGPPMSNLIEAIKPVASQDLEESGLLMLKSSTLKQG